MENDSDYKMKTIRFNNEIKYTCENFEKLCREFGF